MASPYSEPQQIQPSAKPHGEPAAHPERQHQVWTLWYPNAAAQGLFFARGRMERVQLSLAHAVPDTITVEVHTDDGKLVARGVDLEQTQGSPITKFEIRGSDIVREDIWPDESHVGLPVILPGGEIGVLVEWWHREDRGEWRWRVEFYNHT